MKLPKNKLISVLVIIFLILPILVISLIPLAHSADTDASADDDDHSSWLKGVLLMVLSFIINNFTDKPTDENLDHKIGDQPLVETSERKEHEVLGFYVNWITQYANSYDSLQANWQNMDMVVPFWYTLNPDGNIEARYGGHQYEAVNLARNRNLKVLPLINNNQENNMILVDPATRSKAVGSVVELVTRYDYSGVNIDFEFIPAWTRKGYTSFIKELSKKLPRDKMLTISVFPKIDVPLNLQGAYDYEALANYADRIVIMTYDNHWSTGPAGPVAPLEWVEKNIKYALEYIPKDKILLGIANYGYDWPGKGIGKDVSTKKALQLAKEKGAEVKWHKKYQTPYFYYWDEKGNKREVWFENSHSTAFKLDLVKKYNLRGIAIWKIGNGTNRFWETIENKLR